MFSKKDKKEEKEVVEVAAVLETSDMGILAVAKSILEDADIKYVARQQTGSSIFTTLLSNTIIIVKKEDEERAKELLQNLD